MSIFNTMSEEQLNSLSEKYGWNTKPYKSKIDEQTIMFWTLQLQFMSISTLDLVNTYINLQSYFPRTKYVKRSYRTCLKHLRLKAGITQEEHNCVATTLAINLSGLA